MRPKRKALKAVQALGLLAFLSSCQSHAPIDIAFASIPEGQHQLGHHLSLSNPSRIVALSSFEISTTEITNAHFQVFVAATGYLTEAERLKNAMTFYVGLDEFEWVEDSTANWKYPFGIDAGGIEDKMNHPVTCINFYDVKAFCKWAQVRLPTLDEWEAASRGGVSTSQFFGNERSHITKFGNIWLSTSHAALDVEDSLLFTAPVASFKPNPYGLYDVYGNVFEFCSDKMSILDDVEEIACARGGSWWCSAHSCSFFNSVDIGRVHQHASFSNHGFRVVRD